MAKAQSQTAENKEVTTPAPEAAKVSPAGSLPQRIEDFKARSEQMQIRESQLKRSKEQAESEITNIDQELAKIERDLMILDNLIGFGSDLNAELDPSARASVPESA